MKIKDSTKLSSLTDDEKALLHETLKAGLYGDPKKKSRQQMFISGQTNGQPNGQLQQQPSKTTAEESDCDSNESASSTSSSSSSSGKPSRRIILISKPAPKPEPKPEPKYVNGKVVFGQLPTPKGLAGGNGSGGGGGGSVLQRGSVAERVMLFEKCPEKTSVTKGKLTELQRSRALGSPNKIGSWVRGSGTTAEKDYVKIPKIAASNNNCATGPNGTNSQQQQQSANQNHNHSNSHPNQPIYQQKLGRKETEELKSPPPLISSVPTFRRFSRSNSITNSNQQNLSGQLPRFHFPNGRPYSSHEVETQIRRIIAVFERFPSRSVTRKDLGGVLKLVGIPVYWKEPLFCAVVASAKANGIGAGSQQSLSNGNGVTGGVLNGGRARSGSRSNSIDLSAAGPLAQNGALAATLKKEYISCEQFTDYWRRLITTCYDDAARFMAIATQGRRAYLLPEDLEGLIQDVVDTHPGLLFLKEAEEFHSRYVHTVIARIFYCLDRTWSGAVSLAELRKSNLLKVLQLLEEEEDINQITEYFSYEHFYVIYCKFWELDTDHDLYISKYDLSRHNDSAISSRMIDRIFSGAVTRGPRNDSDHQMSYAEFVWFLLSEEDKRHPRAIEYWFRCMDLDGDGALSMYELEYFYSEQVKRMEAAGIEALPFTDCLCQMIDLASPVDPLRITLNDLKRCRLTPVFFDTFFNLEKYLDHEQRDPFASQRDEDGLSMSDWDRYAAEEYELLVAEENAAAAASAQSHASNRFYDYHHGGGHGGHHHQQSLSEQAARHRYHSEECLNLDEYDEEDEEEEDEEDYDEEEERAEGEEEETSSDSTANDYEEMEGESVVKKVGKNFSQLESLPSTTDEEEDDNDSEGNWSAASNDAEEVVEVVPSEKEASSNEIDDIGREFYEYINAEFAPHGRTDVASEAKSSLSSPPSAKDAPMPRALSIKTPALFSSSFSSPSLAASPQRSSGGDRSSDFNNNPVARANAAANDTTLTALDDEDFW